MSIATANRHEMIVDALKVHETDHCGSAPCADAVKLAVLLSTSGINSIPPGHELTKPSYGKGGGHGYGRKQYATEATDKQMAFLTKLIAERDFLSLSEKDRNLVKFIQSGGKVEKTVASGLIDALLHTAYAASVSSNGFQKDRTARVQAADAKRRAELADRPSVEIGLYRNSEGVIVKAYKARYHDGILCARLDVTADKPWIYLGLADRHVTDDFKRMTLDEAKAFGKVAIGGKFYCCQCGIELTDPNSQNEGIGPVCAKRV